MKKATRIISEVEYTNENGDSVHSDLDFDFDLKEQMRPVLHECLDEWLDKSNGEGGFYLRNANHHFEDYDEGQPKRTPLPDGTLELTEEEKKEFIDLILWHQHYELESVAIADDLLTIGRSNNGIHCDYIFSHSVKAILWLARRFNLEGQDETNI